MAVDITNFPVASTYAFLDWLNFFTSSTASSEYTHEKLEVSPDFILIYFVTVYLVLLPPYVSTGTRLYHHPSI